MTEFKFGIMNIIQVGHDDGCPTIATQDARLCTCGETTVSVAADLTVEEATEILTSHLPEEGKT